MTPREIISGTGSDPVIYVFAFWQVFGHASHFFIGVYRRTNHGGNMVTRWKDQRWENSAGAGTVPDPASGRAPTWDTLLKHQILTMLYIGQVPCWRHRKLAETMQHAVTWLLHLFFNAFDHNDQGSGWRSRLGLALGSAYV